MAETRQCFPVRPIWSIPKARQNNNNAFYLCANRGKKSVTVNIAVGPEGQTIVRELAKSADVMMENSVRLAISRVMGSTINRLRR